jgi:hypothetical protein
MRTSPVHVGAVLAAVLGVSAPLHTQQQSNARAGWPCGGTVDPSYFHLAEGTGGHLLLLAPAEIGDSAALLGALDEHHQTIFRLAGRMNAGVHEFRVPVDSSVESVVFSISVQCLQVAEVRRPDGTPAGGAGVTDLSNFRAERMVIARQPEPGVWTMRVAGSGIAGVVAQARSELGLADVAFAQDGSTAFRRLPFPGVANVVRIGLSGPASDVTASIVDGGFRRMAALPLAAGDAENTYLSRFTPGTAGFRLVVEGRDPQGAPFQRVQAPLLTAAR